MKKKIEIDTFLKFQYVSSPQYSPDGNYLAFVVQKPDLQENRYPGDIWIIDNNSGELKQLTALGDATSFVWSKTNRILFAAARQKDEKKRTEQGEAVTFFYEISPQGGEASLTFSLPLSQASLYPINEHLYAVTGIKDKKLPNLDNLKECDKEEALTEYKNRSYEVYEELPFWSNGTGIVDGKRKGLYLYDKNLNQLDQLTDSLFQVEYVSVGTDKILFTGSHYDQICPLYPGAYICDLATKKPVCILEQEIMSVGIIEDMGEFLLLSATDGAKYGTEEYDCFYKIDAASKQLVKLADYEASIGHGFVGSDARLGGGIGGKVADGCYYFTTTVNENTYIRKIDKQGNVLDVYTKEGSCDSFDIYQGELVLCGLYDDKIAELYDNNGQQLTHFNDWLGEEYQVAHPQYHSFKASDGYEIHGFALKPYDFDPQKSYPAILHIHGGPRTAFGAVYHHEMQMWASAGYFVIYCNPRGSDGRGNDFGDISGKYGTVDYQNIMDFTDQMLNQYSQIDKQRVGVTGGSYGGYMTNWIIGHTQRFKAAVSQRSIANWVSFEHTTDIGYFFTKTQMKTTTAENVEKLWWHSPLKYAPKVKTPTLFIHSEEDYRCWMVEGLSMFTALKIQGVDTKLCLFKKENHELSRSGKPKNRIARMKEICDWLGNYLRP